MYSCSKINIHKFGVCAQNIFTDKGVIKFGAHCSNPIAVHVNPICYFTVDTDFTVYNGYFSSSILKKKSKKATTLLSPKNSLKALEESLSEFLLLYFQLLAGTEVKVVMQLRKDYSLLT